MNDTNPFNITREEILELAAQKLADSAADYEDLHSSAHREIKERIHAKLFPKVDEAISAELERLLSSEIAPVNIWGEKVGEPTTIRSALHQRAKDYWSQKVNGDGKPNDGYGGKPRAEWMFEKIVRDEFTAAIKGNAEEITKAFKAAMKETAMANIAAKVDELFKR